MEHLKYDLKIFLHDSSDIAPEAFIPIFHRWIQEQSLDELLIDVVDYSHVHHGPGVMLMAHDAHYAIDMAEGRMGLLYSRRRETHPTRSTIQGVEERLASVFRCVLTACQRLEAEASLQGSLRFRSDTLLLRLNDRLQAPTAEAHDRLRWHLGPLLATLYPGNGIEVDHFLEPKSRLTVAVKTADSPDVTTLLERLEAYEARTGVLS
jgi:hypothetical protein